MDQEIRKQVAEVGRLMYERHLTDSAGGNISVRTPEWIFATPRYAGSKYRWQLAPEQIVALRGGQVAPELSALVSREIQVHLAIYRHLPLANAVIHAHARYVMPFVTLGKPIPPVWEDTQKFGMIQLVLETPAHSADLAEQVATALLPQAAGLTQHAIAILIPKHGIVVAGCDLSDAYDTLERINGNAECILLCKLLEQTS
jgi:ribulose-5-phosphate 4-epimerase/fuculose-1-phosphate aldolase